MFDPERVIADEARGMSISYWASLKPDAPAVHDRFGCKSFGQINARANQIVRLLRGRGIGPGAHIAFAASNRSEVVEIFAACLRGGYRLVPVNWHLKGDEAAYILKDCDAAAAFVEDRFTDVVEGARRTPDLLKIGVGAPIDGFLRLNEAAAALNADDIDDPTLGSTMFYTSGTTGRPKGVFRQGLNLLAADALKKYDPDTDVQLCAGPVYHGAGLTLDTRTAMTIGVPLVYLDRWESEAALLAIQEHGVTHGHFVPIMFQRLLALPSAVREAYDLSSLKHVMHGAAPCPPEVKRAMIAWWGPILHEYYAGTEGGAGFMMDSCEWLKRPGSVGRRPATIGVKILSDDGQPAPAGAPGRIYFQRPAANGFHYYKDPAKTEASHAGDYFTLGDIGYFDEDDYLFLTGRSADCIISGGVNIYPQEIDDVILAHPAVEDVACVGAPNREWGEEIRAVVALRAGAQPSPALAAEIIALVKDRLAGFKAPRAVDFVDALPRNATGKIERAKVREAYWHGRAVQI